MLGLGSDAVSSTQPIHVTDSPGTRALLQALQRAIDAHPGPDPEVVAAIAFLLNRTLSEWPPQQRPFVLARFFDTLKKLMEITP